MGNDEEYEECLWLDPRLVRTSDLGYSSLHEIFDALFFKVIQGIILQVKRDLSATAKSVSTRVRVDLECTIFCGRTENVLHRIGIIFCGRGNGSDFNTISDQETTVETETKGSNQVSLSSSFSLGSLKKLRGARFCKGTLDTP